MIAVRSEQIDLNEVDKSAKALKLLNLLLKSKESGQACWQELEIVQAPHAQVAPIESAVAP